MSSRLEEIWICPPLAFARFGRSETPLENFHWADNDYAPRGTAETVIEPSWTLKVDPEGNLSAYLPKTIRFRDKITEAKGKAPVRYDWRPVCPFFEVHGRWSDGREGPLDCQELAAAGIELSAVQWTVHTANRKAFHYTGHDGDHVDAVIDVAADNHSKLPLLGCWL